MDPNTKDIIEVIAWTAIAAGFVASTVTLYLNSRAVRLQGDALQTSVFCSIAERYDHLMGVVAGRNIPDAGLKTAKELLGFYERLAFWANHGHLKGDMEEYFRSAVIYDCEHLGDLHPALGAEIQRCVEMQHEAFAELREFYRKHTGRDWDLFRQN
ncbi:MAG: hypothetical protein GY800_09710 [Planctomycetes bacterium]|nr:hypothetical protein [Planctomycetota bacterium]